MAPWYMASIMIHGIPVTRYVASWYIGGGGNSTHHVREWLKTLTINGEHLTDDEVELVAQCTVMGMFELQESVKHYLA